MTEHCCVSSLNGVGCELRSSSTEKRSAPNTRPVDVGGTYVVQLHSAYIAQQQGIVNTPRLFFSLCT